MDAVGHGCWVFFLPTERMEEALTELREAAFLESFGLHWIAWSLPEAECQGIPPVSGPVVAHG